MQWNEHTNESLIDYASSHLQHQGIAAMEMQRRHLIALRDFSEASSRQATVMICLTWLIAFLTLALTIAGGFQVWSLLK